MPLLSRADVTRLDELSRSLGVIRDGDGPALRAVVPELRDLLDSDGSVSYGLASAEDGLRVDFFWSRGFDATTVPADLDRVLRATPRFGGYDPFRPEPGQRNRVVHLADPPTSEAMRQLLRRHGALAKPQLRILLCEQDSLMAWTGVFRSSPYGARERAMLARLAQPLRRRALLERQLESAPAAMQLLGAAMEGIGAAAYLLRGMTVAHANAGGRAALAADRAGTLARLHANVGGCGDCSFALSRHSAPGAPEHVLAIDRAQRDDPRLRAARLGACWGLTPAQQRVLAIVATGASNKEIAGALRCSEGTVEFHLTALLARAACDNRAALVARFWTEG